MVVHSPIKWFGGKGGFINSLLDFFPEEGTYTSFLDAYGGSGVVLLNKPYCPVEIYNDLERNVYTFYKVLQDKDLFEELRTKCELSIFHSDFSKEYLYSIKNDELSDVERAYRFFYVNRSRRGGGVGGLSVCNIIRRNMSKTTSDFLSAIDGLTEHHQRWSSVIVLNDDALKLIKRYDVENMMIYLDPPYMHETRTSARYWVDADNQHHEQLIELLLTLKHAKVLLSGYDNELYSQLTNNGWNKSSFNVKTVTGTNERKDKQEVVWYNYPIDRKDNDETNHQATDNSV